MHILARDADEREKTAGIGTINGPDGLSIDGYCGL